MKQKYNFLVECIRISFYSIMSRKLRSFLTVVGIIIGISSVVMITSLGKTLQNTVFNSYLETMGGDFIWADVMGNNGGSINDEKYFITNQMLNDYEKEYADIVTPLIQLGKEMQGYVFEENPSDYGSVRIVGTSPAYAESYSISLLQGRFLTERDCDEERNTIVLSQETAQFCFNGDNPIGKNIYCKFSGRLIPFVIVGVYKYIDYDGSLTSSIEPRDCFIQAYASYSYLAKMMEIDIDRTSGHTEWQVDLKDGEALVDFAKKTEDFFNQFYAPSDGCFVSVNTTQESIDNINQVIEVITTIISAVAVISLFIGGVGVMNIMLINVSSRTKEIGIRKSLGASNNMIRIQFLMESIVLCTIGWGIGILLGILLSKVISFFLPSLLSSIIVNRNMGDVTLKFKVELDYVTIIISFIFSYILGMVFGYYPATKAARKNPVDALKAQ